MSNAAPVHKVAPEVVRYAESDVPTEYGVMRVLVYHVEGSPHEHVAIVKGDVSGRTEVLSRVHSECFTGEVLHSLKCDCREQLDFAMRRIADEGCGVVFYLRQEGRGIGLGNKIRAYALQERGVDTVDANRMLGLPDDARRYHVAAFMCRDLGIRSVQLLTNNPQKVRSLRAEGIPVRERVPVYIEPNPHNVGYLLTKSRRMSHELDIEAGLQRVVARAFGVSRGGGISLMPGMLGARSPRLWTRMRGSASAIWARRTELRSALRASGSRRRSLRTPTTSSSARSGCRRPVFSAGPATRVGQRASRFRATPSPSGAIPRASTFSTIR